MVGGMLTIWFETGLSDLWNPLFPKKSPDRRAGLIARWEARERDRRFWDPTFLNPPPMLVRQRTRFVVDSWLGILMTPDKDKTNQIRYLCEKMHDGAFLATIKLSGEFV